MGRLERMAGWFAPLYIPLLLAGCRFAPAWDESRFPPCSLDADCRTGCICSADHCLPQTEGESCGDCPGPCDDPPPDECEGSSQLKTFQAEGVCEQGACRYPSTLADCPAGCEDGACLEELCLGERCDTGETCEADGCHCAGVGPNCGPDDLCCPDGACVNTATWDDTHCGGCDTDCTLDPEPVCVAGNSVDRGPGTCDGSGCAYDTGSDVPCPWGCDGASGLCLPDPCQGIDCGSSGYCAGGLCTCANASQPCPPQETCCGSECADLANDPAHCGECTFGCSTSTRRYCSGTILVTVESTGECVAGQCDLVLSDEPCLFGCEAGACLETCGPEADICPPGERCVMEACQCGDGPSCAIQDMCCDSVCTAVASDNNHCGTCFKPCALPNAVASCRDSFCQADGCQSGWLDCDGEDTNGCETDGTTEADCGFCGNVCANVETCVDGICQIARVGCDPPCTFDETCCLTANGRFACVNPENGSACDGLAIDCEPGGCDEPATYCCYHGAPDPAITCAAAGTSECGAILCLTDRDCLATQETCCSAASPDGVHGACATFIQCEQM